MRKIKVSKEKPCCEDSSSNFPPNPKTLFLIDGFGALLSAFVLGIVFTYYNNVVGMPREVLYFLAILPCFFAVYDFVCYLKIQKNWQFYLKIIAIANLIYCIISVLTLFYFYKNLTDLGIFYFVLELIIVFLLAAIELKTAAL